MDLIDRAEQELPGAQVTVEQSKAAAVMARIELDKHQQWLGQHQELYAQAMKGCERRLKRQAFVAACKQKAWLPIQLVATASTGLLQAIHAYPRRRSLRANLTDRIQELDQQRVPTSGQLQYRIQAMDRRGPR
jgi:hypothetical protein